MVIPTNRCLYHPSPWPLYQPLSYANALDYGLSNKTILHLQMVQSMCAKLTLRKSKYDSTTDVLSQLQWLPIKHRINSKIATTTHKCLYGTVPQYLRDLLIPAPNQEVLDPPMTKPN